MLFIKDKIFFKWYPVVIFCFFVVSIFESYKDDFKEEYDRLHEKKITILNKIESFSEENKKLEERLSLSNSEYFYEKDIITKFEVAPKGALFVRFKKEENDKNLKNI